jgi:hypothetical protein
MSRTPQRRHLTDAQLIALLRAEAVRLGRTPGIREVGAPGSECPVERVYRKRFGTWADAIRRAGLTPRLHGHYVKPERRFGKRPPRPRFSAEQVARRSAMLAQHWGIAS